MLLRISEAAHFLGVCLKTLRCLESAGYLPPSRTMGGHRRYDPRALALFQQEGTYAPPLLPQTGIAAIYTRVSAVKQRNDLITQRTFLTEIDQRAGYSPKTYSDIASGLNDARKGLIRLLQDAFLHRFDRVYITYPDRLARFGTHIVTTVLNALQIPIIIIQPVPLASTPESTLVQDVVALITSFAGKLHRMRRGHLVTTP